MDPRRMLENMRRFSAPSAGAYDAVSAPVLDPFFQRIAAYVAAFAPERVLDIGSGPGRLAVAIARAAPRAAVVGLDVEPKMVERARRRVARAGLAERVTFEPGDAAALPFRDARFDVVVSTFSLHHWDEPARALAEIERVLRPRGVARIYDVADWITRFEARHRDTGKLLRAAGAWRRTVVARAGPVPIVTLAELRRAA